MKSILHFLCDKRPLLFLQYLPFPDLRRLWQTDVEIRWQLKHSVGHAYKVKNVLLNFKFRLKSAIKARAEFSEDSGSNGSTVDSEKHGKVGWFVNGFSNQILMFTFVAHSLDEFLSNVLDLIHSPYRSFLDCNLLDVTFRDFPCSIVHSCLLEVSTSRKNNVRRFYTSSAASRSSASFVAAGISTTPASVS